MNSQPGLSGKFGAPLQWRNRPISRRRFLKLAGYSIAGFGLATGLDATHRSQRAGAESPQVFTTAQRTITADHGKVIRVGILHSLTGTMAIAERSLVEAELLAIGEINRKGGVLGKRIQPVIEDGKSDWVIYSEKAAKLIQKHQVATVFGCFTSASRKSVLPAFESRNHMLWYPVTYEGQECSKNVFYIGAIPNQQVEPTVDWVLTRFANRPIVLVGSDYVFPRTVNTIIKRQLAQQGKSILGEDYIPLGVTDLQALVRQIKGEMPQGGVIFNSFVGDTNVAFFRQLKRRQLNAGQYPVISFNLPEDEIAAIGPEYTQGHYIAANYFQTIDNEVNTSFVQAFKQTYGRDRLVNPAMASAYTAVYLWKQAVERARTAIDLDKVRTAAIGQWFNAPEGQVVLRNNHHLTKYARIGQIRSDGLCTIVDESRNRVMPQPQNQFLREPGGFVCRLT